MNKSKNPLQTRSLWASAYLILKGHKLVKFELITPYSGHFIFKQSKQIEGDLAEYYGSNPVVPIREYLERYNALRDLVMQTKREARDQGCTKGGC